MMDDRREELSIQKCLMGRLLKRRMTLARHGERTNEDCLARMAYVDRDKGRRGERSHLRWRHCIEREESRCGK